MTQAEQILATGFDLDQLDGTAEEILHRVVVVENKDGEESCGFLIASKNSPEFQEANRKIRVEGLKRSAKRKTAIDSSTDEGAATLAKMIEANDMTLACSVVKGWFGFKSKGQEAAFDKTLLPKMFAKFPTWKEKVNGGLENEANFIKG